MHALCIMYNNKFYFLKNIYSVHTTYYVNYAKTSHPEGAASMPTQLHTTSSVPACIVSAHACICASCVWMCSPVWVSRCGCRPEQASRCVRVNARAWTVKSKKKKEKDLTTKMYQTKSTTTSVWVCKHAGMCLWHQDGCRVSNWERGSPR